jgi:hypothetical protein
MRQHPGCCRVCFSDNSQNVNADPQGSLAHVRDFGAMALLAFAIAVYVFRR